MSRGFVGKSAERFFAATENAFEKAGDAHEKKPFEGKKEGIVPLPRLPSVSNKDAPFEAADAWSGTAHARNAGNSSNIVVDPQVYDAILRRVDMTDHQVGADLYRVAAAIEEMCAKSFVVPETAARVLAVISQVKNSLGQFRALTEDAAISIRRFASAISDADLGNTGQVAVSEASAEQIISRVSSTLDRQTDSMERTANNYKTCSETLMNQAKREHQKADSLTPMIY